MLLNNSLFHGDDVQMLESNYTPKKQYMISLQQLSKLAKQFFLFETMQQ